MRQQNPSVRVRRALRSIEAKTNDDGGPAGRSAGTAEKATSTRSAVFDTMRRMAPLLSCTAFERLDRIAFLGILSPTYSQLDRHPISFATRAVDGTRADHSRRVAITAALMSENLGFSAETIRYAVLWGLLHDIATWPLSHTGEAAFSNVTGTAAGKLRTMILTGDDSLAVQFRAYRALKDVGADIDILLNLFDRKAQALPGELGDLRKLLHSSLTPDTLEGMSRSGLVFGLDVPKPSVFLCALERDLVSGVTLKRGHSVHALRFWRAKGRVYSDYINRDDTVAFESSWSTAIRNSYSRIGLSDSLAADEGEILRSVAGSLIPPAAGVVRYKDPLTYKIALRYKKTKRLKDSMPVEALSEVFVKDRA